MTPFINLIRASSDFDGDYLRFCRTNDSPAEIVSRESMRHSITSKVGLKVAKDAFASFALLC